MSSILKDGHYKVTDGFLSLIKVKSDECHYKDPRTGLMITSPIEYGQFGEVDSKLAQKTGKRMSNIKLRITINNRALDEFGVISSDCLGAHMIGMVGVYTLQWITEKEAAFVEAEKGDSIDAPTCPYKLQPDNQGKFLWITGSPGAGKSTSAQKLARDKGFVFYEGDCFYQLRNPYIPVTAEDATLSQLRQKLLSGPGLEERRETIIEVSDVFDKLRSEELRLDDGEDARRMKRYLQLLCEDITRERARVGGDWAVASALPVLMGREWRQFIRSLLDHDLLIVHLNLTEENLNQRIERRHPGQPDLHKTMRELFRLFKPAEKDEKGIVTIAVDSSLDEEDVIKKILDCSE